MDNMNENEINYVNNESILQYYIFKKYNANSVLCEYNLIKIIKEMIDPYAWIQSPEFDNDVEWYID